MHHIAEIRPTQAGRISFQPGDILLISLKPGNSLRMYISMELAEFHTQTRTNMHPLGAMRSKGELYIRQASLYF